MRFTWVNKRGRLRIQLSVIIYTLIFTLTQTLRGFPFFIDDLIKRFLLDSVSFFIAFTVTNQFKDWLNNNYDWNVNPKKRLIIESILRVSVCGGIIILLHVVLSYIFIGLTLNVTSNPYSDKFSEVLIYYFFGNYTYVGFFDVFIKFLVLVLVIELFVIFDFSSYLIQKWNSSKIEKEAFEKEKAQFSLELLRTQINPHFLFNNLNTLSSLIYINQDKAADFLRKLSGVYRNILEYRNKETILLSEELSFFNTYADLLQVRFMDMLFFDVQVEETLLGKKIIPLTLQMLVENAIKHNVISSNRPLYITIKTENNTLTVSNNLQVKETREYSSGLGLTMISNRYDYVSDRKIVINRTDELFVISVPLID